MHDVTYCIIVQHNAGLDTTALTRATIQVNWRGKTNRIHLCMHDTRVAESESEAESPGAVVTSPESESESEPTKLP